MFPLINKRYRILPLMLLSLILSATVIAGTNAFAASEQATDDVVHAKTAWSQDRAHPGDSVVLALVVNIQKGLHINADNASADGPGDHDGG